MAEPFTSASPGDGRRRWGTRRWTAVPLCGFGIAILAGCQDPQMAKPEAPPEIDEPPAELVRTEPLRLPLDRTLRDHQGRVLDVIIVARSPDMIRLVRKADRQEFDYPIANLALEDQALVKSILVTADSLDAPKVIEPEMPPYVMTREKDLERLFRERDAIEKEILEGDLSRTRERQKISERKRLDAEILRIQQQIEDYKQRTKL